MPITQADFDDVAQGLYRVYAAGEASEIYKEFSDNVAALEARNEATYKGLRDRTQQVIGRCHVLALALSGLAVWLAGRGLPSGGGLVVAMAAVFFGLAFCALALALHASIRADGMVMFSAVSPKALAPFEKEHLTAASLGGYRIWVLPKKWFAAAKSKEGLQTAAELVDDAQRMFGLAAAGVAIFAAVAAILGGAYP